VHAIKAYVWKEIQLHTFLTLALNACEWLASYFGHCTPGGTVSVSHWIRMLGGMQLISIFWWREKLTALARNWTTVLSQPVFKLQYIVPVCGTYISRNLKAWAMLWSIWIIFCTLSHSC
jgi:hypothetical protein